MKIDIETEFRLGEKLWTDGYEIGGEECIPVLVTVHRMSVFAQRQRIIGVQYGVMPESEHYLLCTLKSPMEQKYNDHDTTDFTYTKFEGELFRTREEVEEYIRIKRAVLI